MGGGLNRIMELAKNEPAFLSPELSIFLNRLREIEKAAEVVTNNSVALRRELVELATSQYSASVRAESKRVDEVERLSESKARSEEWEKYHCETLAEARDKADRSRSRSHDKTTTK